MTTPPQKIIIDISGVILLVKHTASCLSDKDVAHLVFLACNYVCIDKHTKVEKSAVIDLQSLSCRDQLFGRVGLTDTGRAVYGAFDVLCTTIQKKLSEHLLDQFSSKVMGGRGDFDYTVMCNYQYDMYKGGFLYLRFLTGDYS